MAALCGALAKIFREVEKLAESRASHHLHDALVVLRPVGRKAVRAVRLELVRKVAARDGDCAPPELLCSLCDEPPEFIMLRKRQARESDAHDLRQFVRRARKEIKRHHHAVVEPLVALAERSRRKAGLSRRSLKRAHELRVVGNFKSFLRRAELREIPRSSGSGRNVKIIRIHHGVRRNDDQRIRLEAHRKLCRPLVSAHRRRNPALPAAPHRRHDKRRMRHHNTRNDSHCLYLQSCAYCVCIHWDYTPVALQNLSIGKCYIIKETKVTKPQHKTG